jgi:hypothetical protein
VKGTLSICAALACLSLSAPASLRESVARGPEKPLEAKRTITVVDAIRMTTLGDPNYRAGGPSYGGIAPPSPDRKRAVTVLRRGNLEQNTNDYSLLVWDIENIFTTANPRVVLTMSSSSNREAIAGVRWFGNDTLTFLGENPGEERQLYAFNIRTRDLRKLTNHPTCVNSYSVGATLDKIAYTGQAPYESLWDEKARRDGVVVSRQSIPDLILGKKGSGIPGMDDWNGDLYFQDPDGVRRMNVPVGPFVSMPSLSPDGRYIVAPVKILTSEEPEIMKHYPHNSFGLLGRVATQAIAPAISILGRYELVDTKTGISRVLLDSPVASTASDLGIVWLPNSQSLVLSDVFLPFENPARIEGKERRPERFTVEVNVANGRLTKIGDGRLRAVEWEAGAQQLICEIAAVRKRGVGTSRSAKVRRLYFAKNGGQWQQSAEEIEDEKETQIILRENMNDPPKIYAYQPTTHQEQLLLDLNPGFRNLRFGRVEEIQWQWSKEHSIKAGLYYPVDYVPGRRYPLVIQTHDWDPQQFWIDGPWTTAYAAQPLAARGIMVLQVQDEYIPLRYGKAGQRNEVDKALAIYESAIDYLDKKMMIDRNRIGIIGFSHTCFYVKYALVHSAVKFAAASVTEGEDGGYLQFMTNNNYFVDAYSLYGGRPFGKTLKTWIQMSPGFNLDKTHTPLRITTLSPEALMYDWEWFEGLTLLHRPVDMVMMRDGTHVLQKPWERVVSQQGNVDWFDFWLKGHEDPDPTKVEQYKRWRELRRLQERVKRKTTMAQPASS